MPCEEADIAGGQAHADGAAAPLDGPAPSRAVQADYWIVLDTNVLVDYARHADGQVPDVPLPDGFIRFIEDNRELVLRLDTGRREMRTFMQYHDTNNSVRVQQLLGRFSIAKRRHLRGYREYLAPIVEHLESVASSDPLSDDACRWLASKRTALASNGFAGAEREEADPAQRRAALEWLLASARNNDTWIMAKAAKLSETKPVRLVSNDGDMITFTGLLEGLTGGRLLVARPRAWD